MIRLATAAALLACLAVPALADFPREGVPEIPNGVSAPFVGSWQVGFPEGEGVFVSETIVDCAAPVVLDADGDGILVYRAAGGGESRFELMEFSGRTSWLPEAGESVIAVWTGADEFYAYTVDMATGSARWDDPRVYSRC